uniref:Uncharacterized protein n=1 Tax=Arion vulgaris TaxID=1028688 RepID=A0A0B6ZJQ9_9EUPU
MPDKRIPKELMYGELMWTNDGWWTEKNFNYTLKVYLKCFDIGRCIGNPLRKIAKCGAATAQEELA